MARQMNIFERARQCSEIDRIRSHFPPLTEAEQKYGNLLVEVILANTTTYVSSHEMPRLDYDFLCECLGYDSPQNRSHNIRSLLKVLVETEHYTEHTKGTRGRYAAKEQIVFTTEGFLIALSRMPSRNSIGFAGFQAKVTIGFTRYIASRLDTLQRDKDRTRQALITMQDKTTKLNQKVNRLTREVRQARLIFNS